MIALLALIACICIAAAQDIGTEIINGGPTNAYPFVAQLLYTIPDGGASLCTASFVQDNLLITAAHCVRDDTASRYQVNQQSASYDVVMVVRHPMYDAKLRSVQQYDIAFVLVNAPYTGTLATLKTTTDYFPRLDNVGYGLTDVKNGGSFIDARNAPPMSAISQVIDCSEGYTDFSKVTCVKGVTVNQGVCFGDSGGPGMADGQLATVASFVLNDCGSAGPDGYAYSVHTTVSAFPEFIGLALRFSMNIKSAVTVKVTQTLPMFFYTETKTATSSACTATSTQVVTITNDKPKTVSILATLTKIIQVTQHVDQAAGPSTLKTSKAPQTTKTSAKSTTKPRTPTTKRAITTRN
jgi:secreted trypsin-like serine protease